MRVRLYRRIEEIDAHAWNALSSGGNPFLRHEFLAALERTGCVGRRTGWEPAYLTLQDAQGLAAAVPAFLKSHSYGEFVFDFSWAEAYTRAGVDYYPKLTVAVPFTPATGERLLVRPDLNGAATRGLLLAQLEQLAQENELSGVHALFLDESARAACEARGWLLRRDCQFLWSNHGYTSFDQYLETFTADKRKKARRERRRVAEAGIEHQTRFGTDLDKATLDAVYRFHRDTFVRHGHEPYLTRAFFTEVARTLGEALMVKVAVRQGTPVAAAIFFVGKDALFGRYWGSAEEYHSLHFETCYHQGIEFCIERGLARFEPGTQGEHKVSRGFEPTFTWSAHHIVHPQFRQVLAAHLEREGEMVQDYAGQVQAHVPYRERRSGGGHEDEDA